MREEPRSPERYAARVHANCAAVERPVQEAGEPMESPLADLLACVAAFGRSLQEKFDPQRFLADFSAHAQRLAPHDRGILDYLEDDGRTFTVFAEHAGSRPPVFQRRYTTHFDPDCRHAVPTSAPT